MENDLQTSSRWMILQEENMNSSIREILKYNTQLGGDYHETENFIIYMYAVTYNQYNSGFSKRKGDYCFY